jgi:signal transduction histidine kinase
MNSTLTRFFRRGSVLPSLLVAAILVVAFNAWYAFRSVEYLLQSENSVQHTWQVINQVEIILGSVKDAETGVRGYLITDDEQYLQPYTVAVQELPLELDTFASLTADNPRQREHLVRMRAILEQRLALLKAGIELHRTGNVSTMQALINSGTGKAEMDQLRTLADRMDEEEQRLLQIRLAAARSASLRARVTVAFASALDFLLIVFVFRNFAIERNLRIDAQEQAERLAIARAATDAAAVEIQALNATLEERVRIRTIELETTNRELEAFSYSVSHDLRAPLRTIDGFSLALAEDYGDAVDDVGKDYIRRVRSSVQRMGQLIDALLQLSRITRAPLVREPVDLSALAASIATDLRLENPGRELNIVVEPALIASADSKLVRVALENLLGNAVKFTAKKPQAEIAFGWDEERSAWFVRDNGAGFDMYYADKLFNAFNRLHGDKDFKGSGIGLATVARVIRRHHGRIWADAAVDRGATFWFTLG